jgi:hypothetical protein
LFVARNRGLSPIVVARNRGLSPIVAIVDVPQDMVGGTIVSAVIGGTASVLGGGKFENGATTAAFGYLFNCFAHECWNKDGTYKYVGMKGAAQEIWDGMVDDVKGGHSLIKGWTDTNLSLKATATYGRGTAVTTEYSIHPTDELDLGKFSGGMGAGDGYSFNGGVALTVNKLGALPKSAPVYSNTKVCAPAGCLSFSTLKDGSVLTTEVLLGPGFGLSTSTTLKH